MASAVLGNDCTWYIYALKDPRTNRVRYVGRTLCISSRLRTHRVWARITTQPEDTKSAWLRSLDAEGTVPTVEVLEIGVGDGYKAAEKKWIAHYRERCADLLNRNKGGEGPAPGSVSQATREKLSRINRGKRMSEESVARMRAARAKQAPPSAETRLKIADSVRAMSDETRAKMSAAASKRLPASVETRAKMAAIAKANWTLKEAKMRAAAVTEEARQKLSAALKGRPSPMKGRVPTAETLAKRSAALLGHSVSAEGRAKMSAAVRGRRLSAETRLKLSERAKAMSDDTRRKISVAGFNRLPASTETRAKMAAIAKANWALKGPKMAAARRARGSVVGHTKTGNPNERNN